MFKFSKGNEGNALVAVLNVYGRSGLFMPSDTVPFLQNPVAAL